MAIENSQVGDAILLASWLLLALIVIHEGLWLAINFAAAAASMAKMGVPPAAPVVTIALQLIAGTAIAVGWHAQLGAAFLGLFCLLTATQFHAHFAIRDELLHFEKDLAMSGGMFVLMIRGAGSWSVDHVLRVRRAAAGLTEMRSCGAAPNRSAIER